MGDHKCQKVHHKHDEDKGIQWTVPPYCLMGGGGREGGRSRVRVMEREE